MMPHHIGRAALAAAALATVRSAAWVSPAVRSRYAAAPAAARLTSTTPPLSRATAHVLLEGIDFEADAEAVSAWVLDQTKECPEDVQVPLQAASKLNKGVAYVAVDDDAALLAASGREMLGRWIRAAAMQPLEKVVWLKVKGLPYETKREDLEAALGAAPRGAAAEGPIREVRWSLTAEGMPTGTAFVRFDTPREAAAARERDGTQLGGRWLDVQLYVAACVVLRRAERPPVLRTTARPAPARTADVTLPRPPPPLPAAHPPPSPGTWRLSKPGLTTSAGTRSGRRATRSA